MQHFVKTVNIYNEKNSRLKSGSSCIWQQNSDLFVIFRCGFGFADFIKRIFFRILNTFA